MRPEAIIFCGIQGSGKSTFYLQKFFRTHVRISLDQLNTRNKENVFLQTCLELQQRFVVDNTNPTKEDRARYISPARAGKFRVIGYFFSSEPEDALKRNTQREGKDRISDVGIWATHHKFETPEMSEGFDELYIVEISENGFEVEPF